MHAQHFQSIGSCSIFQHMVIALNTSQKLERMFWQLLPAPVIKAQVYRLSPISRDEWAEKKLLFDEQRVRCGHRKQCEPRRKRPHSSGRFMSGTKLTWPIRTRQKRLSLGPWQSWTEVEDGDLKKEEGNQVGAKFAACLWIYTKGAYFQRPQAHGNIQKLNHGSQQLGLCTLSDNHD